MDSLLWQVSSRSAETLLIFSLFHFLLAGLTLLMLLRQRMSAELEPDRRPELLLPLGFGLLVLQFALLTINFGASFFFQRRMPLHQPEQFLHGLLIAAVILIVSSYHVRANSYRPRWMWPALALVAALVTIALRRQLLNGLPHPPVMLVCDLIGAAAVLSALRCVRQSSWEARSMRTLALSSLAAALLGHGLPQLLPNHPAVIVWNLDEHLISVALLGFAWAAGERSRNLLDRVFVRLNLTFIVLASLIMLSTAAMEKYQYFRITEERSSNLAEFLRGHVVYYTQHGEGLEQIFSHPEVMKRVVVEFGTIPELREVDVTLRGQRASFWWQPDGEIQDYIGGAGHDPEPDSGQNFFRMTRLPIDGTGDVEFTGTMDFVNQRIGKYIIFIYSSFTLVLLMATGVIGIIVADTDRQLKRQYAELQEAQQQLAQSAKLASIGELAGGMAHEINNPITSILSLASFLSSGKGAERFSLRERKNLQLITDQAERIARLVKGLLAFSRQTQLQLAPVDAEELLTVALSLVQHRLSSAHVRVIRQIQPGLPAVSGDRGKLTEVLVNVLANAVDAMNSGGVLRLRALADPENSNCVRIEVEDSGIGIAEQALPRIFDPFFTTKGPGSGTGLGLSISHGIVKDHGGQIWASSTPGTGTTVFISLPQELLNEAALTCD
jgi:signal transduction histidine kinase